MQPAEGYDYNPAAGAKAANDVGYRPFFMDDAFVRRGRAALAAGDPYWLAVARDATATGTPRQRYGDLGWNCAAMAWLDTEAARRTQYARAGIALLEQRAPDPRFAEEGNGNMDNLARLIWIYDWLYPYMAAPQRRAILANLQQRVAVTLGDTAVYRSAHGLRLGDSDMTLGYYWAWALMHLLNVPENGEYARKLLGRSTRHAVYDAVAIGGIDATAADWTSVRNNIRSFITHDAAGGVWFESSEYNENTVGLLASLWGTVRPALLSDHFPEIPVFCNLAALHLAYAVMPDLAHADTWGDNDHADQFSFRAWSTLKVAAAIQGVCAQTGADNTRYATRLVHDLCAKYPVAAGTMAGLGQGLIWHGVYQWDPAAAAARDDAALPATFEAKGQGVVLTRLDRTTTASLHLGNLSRYDHAHWEAVPNMRLWRRGEWAITDQIGYNANTRNGVAQNGFLLNGLTMMGEFELETDPPQFQRCDTGTVAGSPWSVSVWQTHGRRYHPEWQVPESFVDAFEVQVATLQVGGHVVFVVRGKGTVRLVKPYGPKPPDSHLRYNFHDFGDEAQVIKALARHPGVAREINQHTWEQPVDVPGGFTWSTPRGQRCRFHALAPAMTWKHYDDLADHDALGYDNPRPPTYNAYAPTQYHKQTRAWPLRQVDTQSVLYAVTVGDDDAPPAIHVVDDDTVVVATVTVHFGAPSVIS